MGEEDIKLLKEVLRGSRSGELSPGEAARKAAAIDPDSTVTSLLEINSAMSGFLNGDIPYDEAERIIHARADRHPAIPAFVQMCAFLSIEKEDTSGMFGYLALAKIKSDLYFEEEDVENLLKDSDGLREFRQMLGDDETLSTVWPFLEDGGDHLVNHFLVQDICKGEQYADPDEIDIILSREEEIVPILIGMCHDLLRHQPATDPSVSLLYPITLLGHFGTEEAILPLLTALELLFDEALHESVLALAKLGSRHPELVSNGLKEIIEDEEYGEARLAAVETLGLLWETEGNLDFLLDKINSLEPDDPNFEEMFGFLAWALMSTGRSRASEGTAFALRRQGDRLGERLKSDFRAAVSGFEPFEDTRLEELAGEDMRDICCGPLDPEAEEQRRTFTLVRELEINRGYDEETDETDELELARIDQLLKTGRNEPCPCGSGKKFKKCCMRRLEEERERLTEAVAAEEEEIGALARLVAQLLEFSLSSTVCPEKEHETAIREFLSPAGRKEMREVPESGESELERNLFADWFLFSRPLESSGRTIAEEFESRRRGGLSPETLATLESMLGSRFSIYEVQEVEPGASMLLRDIFSGETLTVQERMATRTLVKWDLFAGRTATADGSHKLCSSIFTVPRELREKVEKYARRKGRELVKNGAAKDTDEFLQRRGQMLFHYLKRLLDKRPEPVFVSAEGDLYCLSEAVFDLQDAAAAGKRLDEHPYMEEEVEGAGRPGKTYSWFMSPEMDDELRGGEHAGPQMFDAVRDMAPEEGGAAGGGPDDSPEGYRSRLLGTIRLGEERLTLETHSRERLVLGKRELEKILHGLLVHRADSIQDQAVMLEELANTAGGGRPGKSPRGRKSISPETEKQVVGEYMEQHYAGWTDEPLPALGGKTPRQAAKTKRGRVKVDSLLKDFENREERRAFAGRPNYDFSGIREELGVRSDESRVKPTGKRAAGESPPQYPPLEEEEEQEERVRIFGPDGREGPFISSTEMADRIMESVKSRLREELEAKRLPARTRLKPALNKLPGPWTRGICMELGLEELPRTTERVKAIVDCLTAPGPLEDVWERLPEPSQRMLYWLVIDNGGFATIQSLSRKFGPDSDNTWWWDGKDAPTTPLGTLRLNGLVFVGKTTINNRNMKIAAVPMELRAGVATIARAPGAIKGSPLDLDGNR
ncbi:MAG: SEC-C domain-containing protein [Actinobacteria bacterium]|nr:SEC-C domain-containing protein [Actinomycetota bacterium]MCG2819200.1 SEC-C domain-containing protein [Actinomycetes bacterium]MBU4217348.1 SEC-C domain-containing protein [Actinomycetota bacterium]MBU4358181.1 SEC-C domain-containing protein [Actinomycetota bacterium]MBU4391607.1 SEC-C domain-containing protein [Actinomycetota bacterium]